MIRNRILAGLTIAVLSTPAAAQTSPSPNNATLATNPDATAQGDVSVTIYNNGQALVQDVRQLAFAAGRTRIEFPDVSAQIRPETLSFNAADTAIIEQNFDYDLLTPGKLMEKAVGQTITLVRTNPATGAETREAAKVLSVAGGVVVQIGNRIEVLRDDGLPVRAVFDRVPPNLRARPTLSVTLESDRAGTRPASIRYLSSGLGWSADYVALFDEARSTIDVQGWVTLTNSSGTTYHNANTLLVAGNVYSRGQGFQGGNYSAGRGRQLTPGTQTPNREQLGDFYLYPIAGRTTIAQAQTKQVSFLDVQAVPARRVYFANVGWMQSDDQPRNVNTAISFSSSREGGLGDALPAGAVRFYQKDQRGAPQFVGESAIGHTPMGSTLSLTTGEAFDVLVRSEVVSRQEITSDEWERSARYRITRSDGTSQTITEERPKQFYRTRMKYTITNAKAVPVTVALAQSGFWRGWWSDDARVVEETITGEQVSADQRLYQVTVPANGSFDLFVTTETRF